MRLDKYLLKNKQIDTRSKAIYFIKSQKIKINNQIITKPAYNIKPEDKIQIIPKKIYVSKGAYKLESFLEKISFSIENKTILDVGCSTGGFTHYFLENKAKQVVAIDVAKDIISKKLLKYNNLIYKDQIDATNKENINCLLDRKVDVISIDVSDISVKKVLCAVHEYLKKKGAIILLYKPHYEGGKGIVSKEEKQKLLETFEKWIVDNNIYKIIHKINSSERGGYNLKGNREIFYMLKLK